MKPLILNLKKNISKRLNQEQKKEEYRLCTPYWQKRLENKKYDKVILKLGYPKNSEIEKIMEFPWRGYKKKKITHKHFGNDPVKVYAIKIKL